ncbi:hypothetical protein BB561_004526 [Smittium simulii]|uniref:Transcription initiation factor TFIID subunit 1 histone acetyltransferase domain-containing protein n=1 Tax=Smittium simulii TaxID=133385 RepID=A0A2T9YFR2_9FUNG|nr:hypothetical protein BB561_004526 [Smittium simulii]
MSLGFLFGNIDQEGQLDLSDVDESLKEALFEAEAFQGSNSFLESALSFNLLNPNENSETLSDSTSQTSLKYTKKSHKLSSSPESQSLFSDISNKSDNELSDLENSSYRADKNAIDYSNIDEAILEIEPTVPSHLQITSRTELSLDSLVERKEISDYDYDSDYKDAPSLKTPPASPNTQAKTNMLFSPEKVIPLAVNSPGKYKPQYEVVDQDKILHIFSSNKRLKFTEIFGNKILKKYSWSNKPSHFAFQNSAKSVASPRSSNKNSTINNLNFKQILALSLNEYDSLINQSNTKSKTNLSPKITPSPESQIPKSHSDLILNKMNNNQIINVPMVLDFYDWENDIVWDLNYQNTTTKRTDELASLTNYNDIIKPRNTFFDSGDWIDDITWDLSNPNQSIVVKTNINDPLLKFDINQLKIEQSQLNITDKDKLVGDSNVDKFNLSNDLFYEALQEGKIQRVRQTFGQLVVNHSLPSVHLQMPFFKIKFSRFELRTWHRPRLILFPKCSPFNQSNKSDVAGDSLCDASEITLKDSADFMLVEYSEEYPPVMSNVGMGSLLVNYYRKRDEKDNHIPEISLGDLFVLGIADVSPFLNFGNVMPGQLISVLSNNLFRAPLFRHDDNIKHTDFLGICHNESRWYLRQIPHFFVAGQTYPLLEVPTPHSRRVTAIIKNRLQIAAYRLINSNSHQLLNFNKLARMFPEYSEFQLRQRLKEFCEYQRRGLGTGFWRAKANIPVPAEDNLRSLLTPEMMCLFESMLVSQMHLIDSGSSKAYSYQSSLSGIAPSGFTQDYDQDRFDQTDNPAFYNEESGANTEAQPSGFTEELFASWNTTRNFINATQGKAMLQLCGEGDTTGVGSGFSFLRVSMKDIFLRAGESIEEKLAEIEARPKSAHRYNVAEQQEIYREEIMKIWEAQYMELSSKSILDLPNSLQQTPKAYQEELLIVPTSADFYLPLVIPAIPQINMTTPNSNKGLSESEHKNKTAAEDNMRFFNDKESSRNSLASIIAKEKERKKKQNITFGVDSLVGLSSQIQQSNMLLSEKLCVGQSSFPGRLSSSLHHKHLVIKRSVKSPYTGETTVVSEVIKDPAVIELYLRQKRIITQQNISLEDLIKAKKQRDQDRVLFEKTHMSTFSLPPPNKNRKEVVRKCGNCGELGHMKTNKKCPRYYEFNAV